MTISITLYELNSFLPCWGERDEKYGSDISLYDYPRRVDEDNDTWFIHPNDYVKFSIEGYLEGKHGY